MQTRAREGWEIPVQVANTCDIPGAATVTSFLPQWGGARREPMRSLCTWWDGDGTGTSTNRDQLVLPCSLVPVLSQVFLFPPDWPPYKGTRKACLLSAAWNATIKINVEEEAYVFPSQISSVWGSGLAEKWRFGVPFYPLIWKGKLTLLQLRKVEGDWKLPPKDG